MSIMPDLNSDPSYEIILICLIFFFFIKLSKSWFTVLHVKAIKEIFLLNRLKTHLVYVEINITFCKKTLSNSVIHIWASSCALLL